MRTLKSIIYVYEETLAIKGHYFRYEMTKEVKKCNLHSLYSLYDLEKNDNLVASTILTYEGVYEIAEAYLTGDKQKLEEAEKNFCLNCY